MNSRFWPVITFLAVVFTTGFLFYREVGRIRLTQATSWSDDLTADCAVVLTGQAYRIRDGINLLYHGQVKKVIVSGVHPNASLEDIFPQRYFYSGIDPDNIVLEKRSTTTYGNAQQSLPLVEALHCRDVVLVTSRLHMYRSLKTFRAIFPEKVSLYPLAIVSGRFQPDWDELIFEAAKSIFYSAWTYN